MLYGATCSAPFQTTLIQKVVTRNEQGLASNNSRGQEAIIKHKSYHILKREWWDYKQGLESLNHML